MINVLLAGGIAMVVALLGTPVLIRFLVRREYGQFIRDDLVQHHHKRGKPTMGGAVIIGATLVGYVGSHLVLLGLDATGLLEARNNPFTLSAFLVLFLLVGLGVVGFLDDFTKISRERSLGLTSTQKLIGQALITIVFALLALPILVLGLLAVKFTSMPITQAWHQGAYEDGDYPAAIERLQPVWVANWFEP